MRRPKKIVLWIASPFILLFVLFLLVRYVVYDEAARPFCHKQITLALAVWTNHQGSGAFPNVEGNSARSMTAMAEELSFGITNRIFRDYSYIPGLRGEDPKDLVMFYFKKPTRWRWHGQPEPKWKARTWIVVPIDSYYWDDLGKKRIGPDPNQVIAYGEQSESLTREQFTNRLMATLEFLRNNNRPNWQAAVKEHTAFLQSLPR